MSTAEAALANHAISAPPPVATQNTWTLKQEAIAREFMEAYGLDRKQISFEGTSETPIFDYDALSTLRLALTDIPDVNVEPGDFGNVSGIATSSCRITLRDGRSVGVFGTCLVGEVLHDHSEVADIGQALKISMTRAMRNGLRAAGFDPVRKHNQAKQQQQTSSEFSDVRTRELAEAHILGAQLGYIVGDNKVAWRHQIAAYFKGKTSSAELTDLERSQFLGMLRAWKSARDRAESSPMVEQLVKPEES